MTSGEEGGVQECSVREEARPGVRLWGLLRSIQGPWSPAPTKPPEASHPHPSCWPRVCLQASRAPKARWEYDSGRPRFFANPPRSHPGLGLGKTQPALLQSSTGIHTHLYHFVITLGNFSGGGDLHQGAVAQTAPFQSSLSCSSLVSSRQEWGAHRLWARRDLPSGPSLAPPVGWVTLSNLGEPFHLFSSLTPTKPRVMAGLLEN